MHRLIIQIGRVCKFIRALTPRFSVMLLLIHDEVLGASNDTSILNSLDGLGDTNTGQNWVRTEA